MEDLEQNVTVSLGETATVFTMFVPSSLHALDNKVEEETNKRYVTYVQQRIGSDNYVNRPVQTFNYQHKQTSQMRERPLHLDAGVFAANWDIIDTNRQEQKTDYENLHDQIKRHIETEMNTLMSNPFSQLPLDQTAIDIHSRYEIPGAAEYVIKDRDKNKDNRTRPGQANVTNSNVAR